MRIARRWASGTVLALAVLMPTTACASPAEQAADSSSEPPTAAEPDSSWERAPHGEDPQLAQAPYMALAAEVAQLDVTLQEEHLANLVAIDVENAAVTVAWAGDVPAELRALVREAAEDGISLHIEPARNTVSQMQAIAAELWDLPGMVTVSIAFSADALTVSSARLAAAKLELDQGRRIGEADRQLFERVAELEADHGIRIEYDPVDVHAET